MPDLLDLIAFEDLHIENPGVADIVCDPTSRYIYVGLWQTVGLRAYTLSGSQFTCVSCYDTGGSIRCIRLGGDYIFGHNYNAGVRAYQFDGTNFTFCGCHDTDAANDMLYVDPYLYVADRYAGLKSFLFTGSSFTEAWSYSPGYNFYCLSVSSTGIVFASTFIDGVFAYSMGDSGELTQLDHDSSPSNAYRCYYDNSRGYLFTTRASTGVYVFGFESDSFTKVASLNLGVQVKDVLADEEYVYVSTADEELEAYTFEAQTFTLVSCVDTERLYTYNISRTDPYLFVSNFTDGFSAYWTWHKPSGLTGWFINQLNAHASEPERYITIAGSDHSIKVNKWPVIRRDITKIKPVNISIGMANVDGTYNDFWLSTHTINTSVHIDIGFTHPSSGTEKMRVYTGHIHKVNYSGLQCTLNIRDKFYDLAQRKVGSTDEPVSFGSIIPSDIAWTLCTCYGGLSDVASTSNPDVKYDSFLTWAETFSQDQVTTQANFEGLLIVEGLKQIFDYTESFGYINGSGQLVFDRLDEVSANDFLIEDLHWKKCELEVDAEQLINRQYISYNYSVASDYWLSQLYKENTSSISSFGLHENILESENIWFTDVIHTQTIAYRKIGRYSDPVKAFKLHLPLSGIQRELGETVRLVNSFYTVSSEAGWRITEQEINLNDFSVKIGTNSAVSLSPFYLDIDYLDGEKNLL